MHIETTINIKINIQDQMNVAARSMGKSGRYVVSLMLRKLADERGMQPVTGIRIRYQRRSKKNVWHHFHVTFTPAEYELFQDLKKVYKMSGSHLVTYAVEKYLTEALKNESSCTDNYRFVNYCLSRRIINGVVCWIQYWGLPPFLIKRHQYQT
jgi:hypothetical protein